MSKVEITGPRNEMLPVLETIERAEVLQIDPEIKGRIDEGAVLQIHPLALDGRMLAERLLLEDLSVKVDRLLALLLDVETRESHLSAPSAVNSIAAVIGKHVQSAEERERRREALQGELAQLNRYTVFLSTVESLAPKGADGAGLEFIGVEVRDPAALEQLTRVAGRLLLGAEVRTARAEDGSYIGLLTTEKDLATKLKEGLRDNRIPEIALPAYLEGLSLPEKIRATRARQEALRADMAALDKEAQDFALSWLGLYENVRDWLRRRLALLRTSASMYEPTAVSCSTAGCHPRAWRGCGRRSSRNTARPWSSRSARSCSRTSTRCRWIAQPRVFKPFELSLRPLPTPRYSSIDPTPFIGIFFPLFFGMILGDIGYGLVLLLVAIGLVAFARGRRTLRQVGQILAVASVYSIIFGAL